MKKRVAIINESLMMRTFIKRTLWSSFRFDEYYSTSYVYENLSKLATADLIIIDDELRGTTSLEVLTALKALPALQGIPILIQVSSGKCKEKIASLGILELNCIVKPCHPADLMKKVKTLIQKIENRLLTA